MNASEAGGDLALIQTSLLSHLNANKLASKQLGLHNKSSEICIKTGSPPALLPFKGQATEQATVKYNIFLPTTPGFCTIRCKYAY